MELKSAEKYLMRVYMSTKNDSYREALAEVLAALRETDAKQKEYEQFMERWGEVVKIAGAVKDVGAERIAELVQADREGRCVVLPCKLGEKVWCLYRECFTKDRSIVVGESTFSYGMIHDFGKTVFLTREEAEKSLKEMEK